MFLRNVCFKGFFFLKAFVQLGLMHFRLLWSLRAKSNCCRYKYARLPWWIYYRRFKYSQKTNFQTPLKKLLIGDTLKINYIKSNSIHDFSSTMLMKSTVSHLYPFHHNKMNLMVSFAFMPSGLQYCSSLLWLK